MLEQLKYSWKRGHVHRERLKQAILGLPPVPSLTYNHVSSTPFTISAHLSESTIAVLSSIVSIKAFEFMVSCLLLTDGSCEVGGSLRLSYHTEENGCSSCCPFISLVCDCAVVG